MPAYHDGRYVDPAAIAVDGRDAGLMVGDGVFETLLVVDGRAVDVDAHLERLDAGLRAVAIAIPESRAQLAAVVGRVAAAAPVPQARLRITVTAGSPGGEPTRIVAALPYDPLAGDARSRGVEVIVLADWPIAAGGLLRGVKSTSYQAGLLGYRRARAQGAFDGLLVNERGRLVEGTRSNVVVAWAGALVTPPLGDGCLPGTVRRRLLEAGLVREASVPSSALAEITGMMLTGSLVGVVPVRSVDGRSLAPGDGWRALWAVWRDLW